MTERVGAAPSIDARPSTTDAPAPSTDAGPPPSPADFEARCGAAGVVLCVGFDDPEDIAHGWGAPRGITSGASTPELDATVRASGESSLHFTIPSMSGSDTSGSYFANFSDDLSVQYEAGDTFFVQWRQRFSRDFVDTAYPGGGGWKQIIIGAGDHPGCSEATSVSFSSGGHCASSCTELEVVANNYYQQGFPILYNSCTGSASHGAYDGFFEPIEGADFLLQNARESPRCLYSQGHDDPPSFFAPDGNCFGYAPDEWMTFQIQIELGARAFDEWVDSHVRLWIAREGMPSEPVIDWGPYNLTAGDPAARLRFGKLWLTPYNTGKDASAAHPVGHTWYDELIVSTARIADPG
jgi:hypothetical protein